MRGRGDVVRTISMKSTKVQTLQSMCVHDLAHDNILDDCRRKTAKTCSLINWCYRQCLPYR